MKLLTCITTLLLLSACTNKVSLNIGESDYRVALPDGTFIRKYDHDVTIDRRKILKDDSISVHLKQVYVDSYSERTEKFLSSFLAKTVRGEIAIVARVFEQGQGEVLDFRNSATKNKGRLIYYSEDVRTGGHMLNLSMLPIYGPITYGGNPLIVQLTVLELDVGEAQQTKALLSTLATLGAKAYAPASPVMKSLEALGEQLLSGEQDDIEMQYIFVLHPNGGRYSSAKYAQLATGDYIVMRQNPNKNVIDDGRQLRFDQLSWDTAFEYCPENGRLIKKQDSCDCKDTQVDNQNCEFRENTYMVVQVNSGFSPVELDSTQTFLEFQEEMERSVDNSGFNAKMVSAVDEFKTHVEISKNKSVTDKIHNEVIVNITSACTSTDSKIAKHYVQETFDQLVSKNGLPAGTTDFTDEQWTRILFELRQLSGNPYNITKTNINNAADGPVLAALFQCNVALN